MPAAPRATPKKQVLIVDDDRAALEAMGAALEGEFRVLQAPDVATSTHVLEQETVDLVILDVVLGQESGLDFLARLRETSDIPVLLISGYGTKDIKKGTGHLWRGNCVIFQGSVLDFS
jgi:DNA-binding response OmpR family regulator